MIIFQTLVSEHLFKNILDTCIIYIINLRSIVLYESLVNMNIPKIMGNGNEDT